MNSKHPSYYYSIRTDSTCRDRYVNVVCTIPLLTIMYLFVHDWKIRKNKMRKNLNALVCEIIELVMRNKVSSEMWKTE